MSRGKNNTVNSIFWKSKYVEKLSIEETLLYLFCITSPESNIAGVYEERLSFISNYTQIPEEKLLSIFKKFEKDGKLMYKNNWIVVAKRKEFNKQDNPSIQSGVEEILKKAPDFAIDFINSNSLKQTDTDWGHKHSDKHTNTNKDKDTNKDIDEIMNYWNSLNMGNIRKIQSLTEKRIRIIKQRLKNKYWKTNWKKAMDKMLESSFLKGETKKTEEHKNWKPNIDWFIKSDTVVQIMEDMYTDKQKKPMSF